MRFAARNSRWHTPSRKSSATERGFSLIEMLIVLAVLLVMVTFATILLQPALRMQRVSNAFNTTLATLRLGRQMAINERNVYIVTLNNAVVPNTITITDNDPVNPRVIETVSLPNDVFFLNVAGIPNTVATTPDHFGTGTQAIGFDQNIVPNVPNAIYFYPDGSAQDANNNLNNGVVYIAQTGNVLTSRAITLWGATGRLRGWRLYGTPGAYTWSQQ